MSRLDFGAIESADDAIALASRLFREPSIAIDTEGDGMFRYRTRLCTIQLASENELAVVDTLAPGVAPSLFAALMSSRGPEKVIHDASFDARLLAAYGAPLGSVFDTSIAARFLGFTATGLASLLDALFDVKLPKHMQQADWGKRPLDEEAIAYLENDVRYLLPLRDLLLERLRACDIEAEMREECAYVLREALRSELEPSPFSRVKGAHARSPRERARVYELALVRDELARRADVPATRLIANELMLRLGELDSPSIEEIARRLPTRVRDYASDFADALERAATRDDAPSEELADPRDVPTAAEISRRKRRRELLIQWRAREATAREVDPQVVLPGHCVNDAVKLDALSRADLESISGFGECRVERYGEALRRALADRW